MCNYVAYNISFTHVVFTFILAIFVHLYTEITCVQCLVSRNIAYLSKRVS